MSVQVIVDVDFARVEKAVKGALKAGADAMARSVYDESQERVPVQSGDLKRSGRVIKAQYSIARVRYGDGAPYALAVEHGMGRGNQFLRGAAVDGGGRRHVRAATAAMKEKIEEASR